MFKTLCRNLISGLSSKRLSQIGPIWLPLKSLAGSQRIVFCSSNETRNGHNLRLTITSKRRTDLSSRWYDQEKIFLSLLFFHSLPSKHSWYVGFSAVLFHLFESKFFQNQTAVYVIRRFSKYLDSLTIYKHPILRKNLLWRKWISKQTQNSTMSSV